MTYSHPACCLHVSPCILADPPVFPNVCTFARLPTCNDAFYVTCIIATRLVTRAEMSFLNSVTFAVKYHSYSLLWKDVIFQRDYYIYIYLYIYREIFFHVSSKEITSVCVFSFSKTFYRSEKIAENRASFVRMSVKLILFLFVSPR